MSETWLETIAHQRDHSDADWEHAGRNGRRLLVLAVLADAKATPGWIGYDGYRLAQEVAAALGLPGCRRLGSDARGGHSWSGYMAAGLRVVPVLRALEKDGLVRSMYQPDVRTRSIYAINTAGLDYLQERSSP